MKKLTNAIFALFMTFTLVSCTNDNATFQPTNLPFQTENQVSTAAPTQQTPPVTTTKAASQPDFDGKIAIITIDANPEWWYSEEPFFYAEKMVEKYGKDKIVHVKWKDDFHKEENKMSKIVAKLGEDLEIKAIIVDLYVSGTNAAFSKLRETRPDIFLFYCNSEERADESVKIANVNLSQDYLLIGPSMINQAKKMGAKTFVHYATPRFMTDFFGNRFKMIDKECEKLKIQHIFVNSVDPIIGETGAEGARKFIEEDMPKQVEKYGKDTAFFASNQVQQLPLIKGVVELGAICPQPYYSSPYYGFPEALGIAENDTEALSIPADEMIDKIKDVLSEKSMLGRVSVCPISPEELLIVAAVEYSIKWLNGEVDKEKVDIKAMEEIMTDYAGVPVYLTKFWNYWTSVYGDDFDTSFATEKEYDNFLYFHTESIILE